MRTAHGPEGYKELLALREQVKIDLINEANMPKDHAIAFLNLNVARPGCNSPEDATDWEQYKSLIDLEKKLKAGVTESKILTIKPYHIRDMNYFVLADESAGIPLLQGLIKLIYVSK